MPRFRSSSRHSARAALRSGTAEELVPSAAFIARGIPLLITKSPAWRLQCDADSRAFMHGSSDAQFAALLERRAGYFCLNRSIVSYRLDQSHVRFEREDGYCARLSSVTDDEMQNWNGPSASLLFHTPPVLPSGYPAPSWEMSNAEIQQIMPQDWCRRESQWRQEHGCLIACHQAEVRGLSAIAVQTRNLRLPEALLPYASSSFLDVETPTIVTYLGVYLMCHPHSKWWFVLESEWIRNTAIAALYWARRGRLPWLSSSVCDAIGDLGISNIFPDVAIQAEFSAILREIELIRWPAVSPRNRLLPWHSSSHTLVYPCGDWVQYFPADHESRLPDSMYLPEDPNNYGYALGGRPSRGTPLLGPYTGLEHTPYSELFGFFPERVEPKGLAHQARPANSRDSLRNKQLHHWLRQHGAAGLMIRQNLDPELPVNEFMTLFKDLLVHKYGPVTGVWPLEVNAPATPIVVVDVDDPTAANTTAGVMEIAAPSPITPPNVSALIVAPTLEASSDSPGIVLPLPCSPPSEGTSTF